MEEKRFMRFLFTVLAIQGLLVTPVYSKKHRKTENEPKYDSECEPGRYCCSCGKSFKTQGSLVQHMSATGHDKKYNVHSEENSKIEDIKKDQKRPELQRSESIDRDENVDSTKARRKYLDEKAKEFIVIENNEKKNANVEYSHVMRKLVDYIRTKKNGKIYSADFRKAGSYSVKTKVGNADEIDTNIVLTVDDHVEEILTDVSISYIYADKNSLENKRSQPRKMEQDRQLKDIPETPIPRGQAVVRVKDPSLLPHLTYKNDLIPHKVLQDLYIKVKTAIQDLKLSNVVLSPLSQGPALTITIRQANYQDINVDLVPSLPCLLPVTINGWPRKDTRSAFGKKIDKVKKAGLHLVPKGDETWSISYSKAENALLEGIDDHNECRREVMRFIKLFLEKCKEGKPKRLSGLSSHIIKTQILWSSERRRAPGYWSKKYFDRCLLDTIDDMVHSLRSKELLEYFDVKKNILAYKDTSELQDFEHCLLKEKKLIENADVRNGIKDEL